MQSESLKTFKQDSLTFRRYTMQYPNYDFILLYQDLSFAWWLWHTPNHHVSGLVLLRHPDRRYIDSNLYVEA